MKTGRPFVFTAFIPVALLFANLGAHGNPVPLQPIEYSQISFADSANGWVSGSASRHNYLLHTTNGGRTWTRRSIPFAVTQMQFMDARRGWALGLTTAYCYGPHSSCRGSIEATQDGGQHWTEQRRSPRCWQLSSLDFANPTDGWAVEDNATCLGMYADGRSSVLRTTDGGRTWRTVLSTATFAGGVHFGDRLNGWFATSRYGSSYWTTTVFHSTNGGRSWRRQLQLARFGSPYVDFPNSRSGWLLVTDRAICSMGGCYDNRLYHTKDGGTHWNLDQGARLPEPRVPHLWSGPSGFLGGLVFVTPHVGYIPVNMGAGPGEGGIDVTRDGGLHWVREQPYHFQVMSVSPIDGRHAWAVGRAQAGCSPGALCNGLLHTSNAGRTWRLLKLRS